jgi:hypothetical protein
MTATLITTVALAVLLAIALRRWSTVVGGSGGWSLSMD